MRKLVPVRGSVVCRKLSGGASTTSEGGVVHKKSEVDIYEILQLPLVPEEDDFFKVGDQVVSNSTGDVIEINPGETVYLFKVENLMCKVCDGEDKDIEKEK